MVQPLGSISAVLSGPAGESSRSFPETVVGNLAIITTSDTLNTNPRYGQYLTHAHSLITRAVAAMDNCFRLVRPHQHGYAMLMRPNKTETAVHGCHCPGDKAVRMR